MKELNIKNINLKHICKSGIHSFVFDSIIKGNTPGQIFVDDIENTSIFLIYEGNCVYFCGEVKDKNKYKEVINFFKETYLSRDRREQLGIVKVNYYPEVWETELFEELNGFKRKVADRTLLKQELIEIPIVDKNENGLIVKKIDKEVLENSSLGNLECVIDEIEGMWGSTERFLSNGFGYCAIIDGNIISWCTAEYVSENYCGVGIETIEAQEGKGVATIVANEFLNRCKALNIIPYWDSWEDNTPSIRVAEKNGFTKICDYKVLLLKLN